LAGIADYLRQAFLRLKTDFDRISTQRMFMKLERALDDVVEIERFF